MSWSQVGIDLKLAWRRLTWPRSYHFLVSASSGHPDQDVFPHISLCGVPADVQGAGGGVGDLQVPHETQRF